VNLFCGPQGLKGGYGITFPIPSLSKSIGHTRRSIGFGGGRWSAPYFPYSFDSEQQTALAVVAIQLILIGYATLNDDPATFFTSTMGVALTGWIAKSKHYWNQKKSPYSLEERRTVLWWSGFFGQVFKVLLTKKLVGKMSRQLLL
jgi:hypothetical protein